MLDKHESNIDSKAIYTPEGSRGGFFQWVTRGVMGVIGLGLAVPPVGYVASPTFKRREQTWVDVGGVNEIHVGEPAQLEYIATIRDGYVETKTHKAVWAMKHSDGLVTAFFADVHAPRMRIHMGQRREAFQMSLPRQCIRYFGTGVRRSGTSPARPTAVQSREWMSPCHLQGFKSEVREQTEL